jgi:hypothetical protein
LLKIKEEKMLNNKILDKYWGRAELKGLSLKRALKIIEILEIWDGEND